MKKLKSVKQYLDTISSDTYSHLTECIRSETTWENNQIRTNPAMFELFSTHEHLGAVREQLFKFAGIRLDKNDLLRLADEIEQQWKNRLPVLFPGYNFAVLKDNFSHQVAFCRVRKGITDNPEEVLSFMRDSNSNIRWNALLSATLYPNSAFEPQLETALSDDCTFNVIQALSALGNCGNEHTAEQLVKRFSLMDCSPLEKLAVDDFIAYDLFETLLKLGLKGYQVLLKLLSKYIHLTSGVLEYLSEVMGKTNQPEVLELLVKIYFTCPDGSEGALNGLLNMEEVAFSKIVPFTKNADSNYREKAMWFMANCCLREARPILLAGLQDKSAEVREAAVHGIGRFATGDRETVLIKACHDSCIRVRARALKAMGNLYDYKFLPLFQHQCYDKSPAIRFEAMCAITNLKSVKGLKFLSDLFSESSTRDKLRILYSLYGYSGKRSLLNPLIKKARCDHNKSINRELKNLIGTLSLI